MSDGSLGCVNVDFVRIAVSDVLIWTGGDGESSAAGRETGRAGANRGRD